jgi:tetratricopeptide (TPR) repeat protein
MKKILLLLCISSLGCNQMTAEDYFNKAQSVYNDKVLKESKKKSYSEEALYDKEKGLKDAIQQLNEAIRLDSSKDDYYSLRGDIKHVLSDYRGAIIDYTKTAELNPNEYYPYCWKGWSQYNLGDREGAVENFNKAIELYAESGYSYGGRGLIKIELGDKNGGCLDLSKAGELGDELAYKMIKQFCN